MNRRQAVVFKMMYGWDNLSPELQTVLLDAGAEKTKYCVDYGERDILWVEQKNLDTLCQEPLFWSAIINQEIRIYKNVAFKIKIPNDGTQTANLSKDGNYYYMTITDTSLLSNDSDLMTTNPDLVYLTDQDYNDNFKEEIIDEFLEGEI